MVSLLLLRLLACCVVFGLVQSQDASTCDAQADILLILDSTASIGSADYTKMLKFVANLTHSFNIGPKAIQFGAIVFADITQNLFNFGTYTDHTSLENAIIKAPYLAQSTNTDQALKFARLQSFTAVYGARPSIARIAIVLTDGGSNDHTSTASEAKLLKDAGVLVLSIGIGSNLDQTELQTIASSPSDVFQVNNFDILNTIAKQVTNKTCEEVVSPPKQVLACDVEADILFIMDSSSSISTDDYKTMINFVVNLTRSFNIGPNAVQFSSIVFGSTAVLNIDFSNYTDHPALEAGLLKSPYLGQQTYTDKALDLARQQAFTVANGARIGVPWIIIILTDGMSTVPTQTATQAQTLKNSGVTIFSIGIGNSVDKTELTTIASSSTGVFTVDSFNILDSIQQEVVNKTCEEVVAPKDDNTKCNVTQKADILFILDSSGSIVLNDYNLMLDFVVNLTQSFNIGPSEIQFASIIFGTDANEVFDFRNFTTHAELEQGIIKTAYIGGWTYTDKALRLARETMFTTARGARPGVPKIAIVFTDGGSTNKTGTEEQSKLLKDAGTLVISIGIGSGVDQQELLTIASLPEDVFQVTNFNVLSTIQKQVTNRTCHQVTSQQEVCDAEADILFLMDSSGSILLNNYNKMLNFVVNLTRNFNIGTSAVQFGNIIFSDNAMEVFDFNRYTNHSTLEQGILSSPYLQGSTYTNKALQLARVQTLTATKGSRPNVPKIAIVLTDGQSTIPSETSNQARLLKNTGVLVLSIGIGGSVNKQELINIASLPQDVFQVTNFDVLDTIQKQVANKTCERVTEEKPACPAVADILFVMDSTGSISEDNYKTMLTFIANFTRNFAIGPNWAQFSGVTFGDTAHNEFSFNAYTTHQALEKGILNATYFGETTQTNLALQMARELSFTSANGARPGVDKIAIVLTDGRSNDPDLTAKEARALKDMGVLVLTVAIGVDILNKELEAIATLPEDVFHVDHFDVLDSIEKEFSKQACDRVTQTIECEAQADVLLILDSSASISATNYHKMLNFLANLTQHFDLGPNAVQFSSLIFGNDAHIEFDFGKFDNHPSLEQGILGITYLAQNTYTNRALLLARLQAFTAAHGARANVSKIAIVLTDGQSALPTETTREAQLLKDTGVLILSVGIGDTVTHSELQNIASFPSDVFQVTNFDVLNSIQKSLTNKTCEKVTGLQDSACSKVADIIFLLDSSGSVSSEDYRQQLLFAANFTDNFQIGPGAALFGAVIFSDKATTLFDLDDFNDHWSILQSLLNAPHLKGGTNTAEALDTIFNKGLFDTAGGGRNSSSKMLIVMTDGQSANVSQSTTAAQRLKNSGVHIMAIGVGDVVNVAELNGIATDPSDVFKAANYEVLHQLQNEVTNHTCGFTKPATSVVHRACSEMADILFVMDSSSSITPEEYQKQLLFASNLTQEFDLGPVDARFAAVVFSNDVFKVFGLGDFSTYLNLFHGFLSAPHLTGTADIGKALNWVNDMEMLGAASGGRDNASKIVVLFSDNPSIDQSSAIQAADRLKRDGVHITAVGVNNYDLFELRQIASDPASVFKATSFDSLHWIQTNLVDDICDFASRGLTVK